MKAIAAHWLLGTGMVLAAACAHADPWGNVVVVSETMGVTANRICIGEGLRVSDIGCPSYAPSITTAGDVSVTGNLSAATFIGDGSGLTGVTAGSSDRIVSGTTSLVAISNTGYISLTQSGVNTGWFNPQTGFVTIGVSSTGPISGTNGYFSNLATIRTIPLVVTSTNMLFGRTTTAAITPTTNTGFGYQALNVAGLTNDNNSAFGYQALLSNLAGGGNTALGYQALRQSTGNRNTAVGEMAGANITTGSNNIALGQQTFNGTTTGNNNIAIGYQAFLSALTGSDNIGLGQYAMSNVTSGARNLSIGNSSGNATTGSDNITLGYGTSIPDPTASSQLNIGNTIYGNLSTKKIAIGVSTTAPSATLTVSGSQINTSWTAINMNRLAVTPLEVSGTISATALYVNGVAVTGGGGDRITSGTSSVVVNSATSTISFSTAGSQRMVIDGSGNVGIGTSIPAYSLDISSSTQLKPLRVLGSDGSGFILGSYGSTGWAGMWNAGLTPSSNNYALLTHPTSTQLNAPSGGSVFLGIADAALMTVRSTGNVGIGTTAPAQTLSVSGTAYIASSTAIGMSGTPSSTLQVSGTIQLSGGTGAEVCGPNYYGQIRRNPVTKAFQICRE